MNESWDRETRRCRGGLRVLRRGSRHRRPRSRRPGGTAGKDGASGRQLHPVRRFFRITDDVDKAFAYLKRMCLNTVPDPVIHTFAKELRTLSGFMKELADDTDVQVQERHGTGGTYRFDGGPPGDAIGLLAVKSEEAQCYPWLQVHGTGWIAFKVVDENVGKRDIEVSVSTPVRELVSDGQGRVAGVVAERQGRPLRIRARKGVVLAAGASSTTNTSGSSTFRRSPSIPSAPGQHRRRTADGTEGRRRPVAHVARPRRLRLQGPGVSHRLPAPHPGTPRRQPPAQAGRGVLAQER